MKIKIYSKKIVAAGLLILLLSPITIASTIMVDNESSLLFTDGTIWYVGGSGPGNYSSIQQAIYNASKGDTIFVYSGRYYENININKQITVLGEDNENTIIDGQGGASTVTIGHELVHFEGFTITNATDGIYLHERVENMTLTNNIITENSETGLHVIGFCENNLISNNIISNNYNGTYISTASYNQFIGNTIRDNEEYGLQLMGWCNENTISNNNFMNNRIDATFFLSVLNKWTRNYWNRPHLLPKPIFGLIGIIPWLNFDFLPRATPYTP